MTLRSSPILAAVAVLSAAVFALWPMRPRIIIAPTVGRVEPAERTLTPLDLAAFRTPIWVAEPPPPLPPSPVPAPPPPPPLKLQLLAIIHEAENDGTFTAAVYDPDSDRVLVVAAGQKLGLRSVERVDRSSVTFRDETGTRTLALKDGGTP